MNPMTEVICLLRRRAVGKLLKPLGSLMTYVYRVFNSRCAGSLGEHEWIKTGCTH